MPTPSQKLEDRPRLVPSILPTGLPPAISAKKRATLSDHPIAIARSWLQVGLPAAKINLNYNRKTFQPQRTPRAQSKNGSLRSLRALWLSLRAVEHP
jgi:hypothetical protein